MEENHKEEIQILKELAKEINRLTEHKQWDGVKEYIGFVSMLKDAINKSPDSESIKNLVPDLIKWEKEK